MKLIFFRDLTLIDGWNKEYKFKRRGIYELDKEVAEELIQQECCGEYIQI